MKLLNRVQVNSVHADHTFKTSPWIMLIPSALIFAICSGLIWGIVHHHVSAFYWFVVAMLLPVAILSFVVGFLPTLPAQNWVMKIKGRNIYVALQDYRIGNSKTPAANVAIFGLSDVVDVKEHQRLVKTNGPKAGKQMQWTERYLEFELKDKIPTALHEAIRIDSQLGPSKWGIVSKKRFSSPVSIDGNKLRILWKGRRQCIRPSLQNVLEIMSRFGSEPSKSSEQQCSDEIMDDEFEDFLVELCKTGERISAIKLLREQRGLSITDSVKELESLADRQPQKQLP